MSFKEVSGFLFLALILVSFTIYYIAPYNDFSFIVNEENYNFTSNYTGDDSVQFYPNMRYVDEDISFYISEKCSIKKNTDARDAFAILGDVTNLNFYPDAINPEINVTCDERTKFENGVFVAGEGGPVRIIKSGKFNIVETGMILLLKGSDCTKPNIAIHEILHALGFKHSNNPNNVMYNFTSCDQTIGDDTISLINELYDIPSLPDLAFESASASLSGRYLDLEVGVRNIGISNSENAKIIVTGKGKILKEIELKELQYGSGVLITVNNIFIKSISLDGIEINIETDFEELDKENNLLELELKK